MHEVPYPNENQDNIIDSKYLPQKGDMCWIYPSPGMQSSPPGLLHFQDRDS